MMATPPRWTLGLAAVLAVLGVAFGQNPHPHMWWESIPGNAGVIGYVGAYALVFLAKSVLAPRLRRDVHDSGTGS